MLDEARYLLLAGDAFKTIEDALADLDPDDVDLEPKGDVLTITLKDGVRCVVNTQRPTRQIWVAARARAWHFRYDEPTSTWLDDKKGDELFATLRGIVRDGAGLEVAFRA